LISRDFELDVQEEIDEDLELAGDMMN